MSISVEKVFKYCNNKTFKGNILSRVLNSGYDPITCACIRVKRAVTFEQDEILDLIKTVLSCILEDLTKRHFIQGASSLHKCM